MAIHRQHPLAESYNALATLLYSAAHDVLGDDAEAADCVRDALVRVWEREDGYRVERGSLRAFLTVRVRNEAIDRRRNAAQQVDLKRPLTIAPALDDDDVDVVNPAARERLKAALSQLPTQEREPLELAYFHHFTQAQIGEMLGMPVATIKSRLAKAMRNLRSALTAQLPRPSERRSP